MQKLHNRLMLRGKHYAKWHNHPRHKDVHWLVFLFISIVLTLTITNSIETSAKNEDAPGISKVSAKGPKIVANQILVRVKESARGLVHAGSVANSGLASLSKIDKNKKVKSFTKVVKPNANSNVSANINGWYLVAFEDSSDPSDLDTQNISTAGLGANSSIKRASAEEAAFYSALETLKKDPNIDKVELNYIAEATWIPNDPYYASSGSWGQSFKDLWGLYNASLESAWDISKGAGVTVAVIDTGVDYTHPDIQANMWKNPKEICGNGIDDDANGYKDDCNGWNFVSDTGNPMDDFGHGTHVAGTIAATGNNGIGMVGVAPEAKIMAVKALDGYGSGNSDDLANAIYYAADQGAKVINASWGGGGPAPQIFIDAISYAKSKGSIFIAAAGNSSMDVGSTESGFYPANVTDAFVVAATDHLDKKAYFSNFGTKVDVAAPGGGDSEPSANNPIRSILSLLSSQAKPDMTGSGALVIGGNYVRQAGTSMAAPHAAGLAALIISKHPEYTPEQVRQVMRQSSDDIETPGFDINSGYGRINALKALQMTAPLEAIITSPSTGLTQTGKSSVVISGRAAGTGFSNYVVEYGVGSLPSTWTSITTSNTVVLGGTLATWDLSSIADGVYTIRLVASNTSGQKYEYRILTTINNILITSPDPVGFLGGNDPKFNPVHGGSSVQIMGTVAPALFTSYSVQVKNLQNVYLSNPNITLSNGGTQKISNSLIATWNTGGVPDDYYVVELTVNAGGTAYKRETRVIVDSTLRAGWPKEGYIKLWGNGYYTPSSNNTVAADLLGNGKKEIITAFMDKVHAYNADGTELPGWPITITDPLMPGNLVGALTAGGPAVGDLDGDGKPEVVVLAGSYGFVWHGDGTPMTGWPQSIGLHDTVAIDDINGDGRNELVYMYGGHVTVYDPKKPNSTGMLLQNCQGSSFVGAGGDPCNGGSMSPVAIGDLNGDGKKEIVYKPLYISTSSPGNVYVVDGATGKSLPGWPQATNRGTIPYATLDDAYPSLGDINGDGKLDVVAGGSDKKVYAFNADGTLISGWPQSIISPALTPAIGDIDGDGVNDVAVGSLFNSDGIGMNDYTYAWKGNGNLLPGYPTIAVARSCAGWSFIYGSHGTILADVNGDGRADVVNISDVNVCAPKAVQAFQSNGVSVPGFPKMTSSWELTGQNTPVIADMNNDGKLEMAWMDMNGYLYLWDLPGSNTKVLPWPMFQHDAMHTGRNAAATPVVAPSKSHISYSPAGLNFSITSGAAAPASKTLTISNSGGTTLAWAITTDRPWCHASPASGTVSSGASSNISVSVDALTTVGTFSCNIVITDPNADNSPQTTSATYTVAESPTLPPPPSPDTTVPVVSIISPAGTTTVSGKISISVSATDNIGVTKVELYVNNTLQGTVSTSPYNFSLDTTTLPNATATLAAKAYDAANNTGSASTQITVNNPVTPPKTQPHITLTPNLFSFSITSGNPAPAAKTLTVANTGASTMNWTGSTNQTWCHVSPTSGSMASGASTNVSVSVDALSTPSNVSCTISISDATADNNPQTASVSYSIAAAPTPPDTTVPTVSLTTPASGNITKSAKTNLTATAVDNTGVTKVEFYVNQKLQCTDLVSPYSCSWNVPGAVGKTYAIQAKAYDAANNIGLSTIVNVTAQ